MFGILTFVDSVVAGVTKFIGFSAYSNLFLVGMFMGSLTLNLVLGLLYLRSRDKYV